MRTMCYPHIMPRHITALYVFTVVNLALLLNFALVDADIIVLNKHNGTLKNGIQDAIAQFGPNIPDNGIWGHIAYAEPNDGCTEMPPPPSFPDNHTAGIGNRWISLMRRGGCNFDVKVLNAERAGYIAAIVHNVNQSNTLIHMGGGKKAGEVGIPSVFIGYNDGIYLWENYDNQSDINLVINGEIGPPTDHELAMAIVVVFGALLGVSVVTLIVLGAVRWGTTIHRRQRSRLSKAHLKKIPIHKFKKGDPYDVCAICIDDYEEGEKLRVLPCNHAYHQKCIDPWLLKNKKTCPICKQKVIPGPARDSDSESEADTDDENVNAAATENTPLLRGENPNNRPAAPAASLFGNSGVPQRYRSSVLTGSEDSDGSPVDPMQSMHHSSVQVHNERDTGTRDRPRSRGGLNTRYNLVDEQPAAEQPRAASPQIRPRPYRAWEFGVSPAGSADVASDEGVVVDIDDVAPTHRRNPPIAYVNPILVDDDAMQDHIESHMDAEANQQPSRSVTVPRTNQEPRSADARPRRKKSDSDGLLLVHKSKESGRKHSSSKSSTPHESNKKSRANERPPDVENMPKVSPRENETVQVAPTHPAQNESETGNSPVEGQIDILQGAVGGAVESVSDSKDAGTISNDEVEVVRSSSRHKKKSRKKRRGDENA